MLEVFRSMLAPLPERHFHAPLPETLRSTRCRAAEPWLRETLDEEEELPASRFCKKSAREGSCAFTARTPLAFREKSGFEESGSGGGVFPDPRNGKEHSHPAGQGPLLSQRARHGREDSSQWVEKALPALGSLGRRARVCGEWISGSGFESFRMFKREPRAPRSVRDRFGRESFRGSGTRT